MELSLPFEFVLTLGKWHDRQQSARGVNALEREQTFSFKCKKKTIAASKIVVTTTVSVTHGIHSPGLR